MQVFRIIVPGNPSEVPRAMEVWDTMFNTLGYVLICWSPGATRKSIHARLTELCTEYPEYHPGPCEIAIDVWPDAKKFLLSVGPPKWGATTPSYSVEEFRDLLEYNQG